MTTLELVLQCHEGPAAASVAAAVSNCSTFVLADWQSALSTVGKHHLLGPPPSAPAHARLAALVAFLTALAAASSAADALALGGAAAMPDDQQEAGPSGGGSPTSTPAEVAVYQEVMAQYTFRVGPLIGDDGDAGGGDFFPFKSAEGELLLGQGEVALIIGTSNLMKQMGKLQNKKGLNKNKNILPLHPDASIYFLFDQTKPRAMRCMMTGPAGSPTAYGVFFFDCVLSSQRTAPPSVICVSAPMAGERFNPNLYTDGKVCHAMLGTTGSGEPPKWREESTLSELFLQIQTHTIGSEDPMWNLEFMGKELMHTESGRRRADKQILEYRLAAVRGAIIAPLQQPPKGACVCVRLGVGGCACAGAGWVRRGR